VTGGVTTTGATTGARSTGARTTGAGSAGSGEIDDTELRALVSAHLRELRACDRLLPPTVTLPGAGAAERVAVRAPDGRLIAAGLLATTVPPPGSITLTWSAAVQHQVIPLIGETTDRAAAMARIVAALRARLATRNASAHAGPDADDRADTSVVLSWPSRDTSAARVLLEHGLHPLTVVGVRTAVAGPGPAHPGAGPGVRIRPARRDDLADVVRLRLVEAEYAAGVGYCHPRPHTADRYADETLAGLPAGTTMVADDGGELAGVVVVAPPGPGSGMAGLLAEPAAGYLEHLAVRPGARGRGIGAALVDAAHQRLAADGARAVLLHYSLLNPLSVPFWGRHGYRPLWTVWERRPARDWAPPA
jgi:ribosomal protein S18 acetylase RimI-like enzyme